MSALIARSKPTHPPYAIMVVESLKFLGERKGSSKQKITNYIKANYAIHSDDKIVNRSINNAIKKCVEKDLLSQVKGTGASGSFKLHEKKKPAKKPKVVKQVRNITTGKVKKVTISVSSSGLSPVLGSSRKSRENGLPVSSFVMTPRSRKEADRRTFKVAPANIPKLDATFSIDSSLSDSDLPDPKIDTPKKIKRALPKKKATGNKVTAKTLTQTRRQPAKIPQSDSSSSDDSSELDDDLPDLAEESVKQTKPVPPKKKPVAKNGKGNALVPTTKDVPEGSIKERKGSKKIGRSKEDGDKGLLLDLAPPKKSSRSRKKM